jgi:TnsA endonuclease N terminal
MKKPTKYSQDEFIPKNPQKLLGNARPFYRSSWELTVMSLLDQHPNVIHWASESVNIPYINPLTGRQHTYIPDFLVVYKDKNGTQRADLVEVKPRKEAIAENAKSKRDKAALLVNTAKWAAAMTWCKKNGVNFRLLTEDQIYVNKGKDLKKKKNV